MSFITVNVLSTELYGIIRSTLCIVHYTQLLCLIKQSIGSLEQGQPSQWDQLGI